MQSGVADVDFWTRTTSAGDDTPYRQFDPVRMQPTRDNARANMSQRAVRVHRSSIMTSATSPPTNGSITPEHSPLVRMILREAVANMATGDSVLEQVTSDPKQAGQTTKGLGSFHGTLSSLPVPQLSTH